MSSILKSFRAAITKTAWPLHEERIRSDISRFSVSHSYKKAFEEKGAAWPRIEEMVTEQEREAKD